MLHKGCLEEKNMKIVGLVFIKTVQQPFVAADAIRNKYYVC
jgi:hypothetical protein